MARTFKDSPFRTERAQPAETYRVERLAGMDAYTIAFGLTLADAEAYQTAQYARRDGADYYIESDARAQVSR